MGIEIQARSQYDQFTDFALDAAAAKKDKAVVGSTHHGMTIVPKKTWDFVGHISRSAAAKKENNDVREIFKNSILGMFGVKTTGQLPPSVQTAMKLEDYDKGKPLTARRILAVKEAVDAFFVDKAKSVEKAAQDQGVRLDDNTRKLINEAVRMCYDDQDVLDVVTMNIKGVLFKDGGTGAARDVDGIRAKVVAIAANVDELREATKGDDRVFAAAKEFLGTLEGTIIDPLLITCLVGTVQKMDLEVLKRLTPDASAKDIQDAALQFPALVEEAMDLSGATNFRDDVQEQRDNKALCRAFLTCLIFAKGLGDGVSSLHELQRTLEGETAQKLKAFYRDGAATLRDDDAHPALGFITEGIPDCPVQGRFNSRELSKGERQCMAELMDDNLRMLDEFKLVLDDVCGRQNRPIVATTERVYQSSVDPDCTLMGSVADEGFRMMAADRQKYLRGAVKGNGTSADALRFIFERKLRELKPYKAADGIRECCQDEIRDMLCANMAKKSKELAGAGGKEVFKADQTGFTAMLPHGVKLSSKFVEARRQIAQFIIGGKVEHFHQLSPSDRKKVYIVMALLSKGTVDAAFNGPSLALAVKPKNGGLPSGEKLPAFVCTGDPKTDKMDIQIEFDKGDLKLTFTGHRDIRELETRPGLEKTSGRPMPEGMSLSQVLREDGGLVPVGADKGSSLDVKFVFKLGQEEFNRIAGTEDFTTDASAVTCSGFTMSPTVTGDIPRIAPHKMARPSALRSGTIPPGPAVPKTASQPPAEDPKPAVAAASPDKSGKKKIRDFAGNVFRSEEAKAANDAEREEFLEELHDIFGPVIPDSVKAEMKLDDYGKGKPLSQHRIKAVEKAANKFFAKLAEDMEKAAVLQGVTVDDDVRELIHAAVMTCKNVQGAIDFVMKNARDVLLDVQRDRYRTDEAIVAMVTEVREAHELTMGVQEGMDKA